MLNYRPGLGKSTLEFLGRRVNAGQTSETVARQILEKELGVKELGVKEEAIAHLTLLNPSG
jgi:hypothetical protein